MGTWDRSKIGPKTIPATGYEDLRDPAKGEKVPRCAVCGMPTEHTLVGPWDGDGLTYRIRVCDHCIGKDRQPNPDPLTVAA